MCHLSRFLVPSLLIALTACDAAPAPAVSMADLGIARSSEAGSGVFCSGQPDEMQFDRLRAAGVGTVISLRTVAEAGTGWEELRAMDTGIAFIRLPIAGAEDINEANARLLDQQLGKASGSVLVCCGSSNRVGALMALRAHYVGGKSAEESIAIGKACGMTRLEARVTEVLGK